MSNYPLSLCRLRCSVLKRPVRPAEISSTCTLPTVRALDRAREEGTLPTGLQRPSYLSGGFEAADSDSEEDAAVPAAGAARPPAPRAKRIRRS